MFKPILFNTEMVKAIKDGRKTQTRRVAKELYGLEPREDGLPPEDFKFFISPQTGWLYWCDLLRALTVDGKRVSAPVMPGNILWVRETWCENKNPKSQNFGGYEYRADYEGALCQDLITWKPSIHMPKEAARIFLRVKNVRVERLQDITEEQAEKEGCSAGRFPAYGASDGFFEAPEEWDAVEDFQRVWNNTIKCEDFDQYGWDANPWVWVIEFEQIEKPKDWV